MLKPLGQGGMGSVYLAEDTVLRRRVAVKVPLLNEAEGDAMRQRFYREARSAAAIKHPNVCPILDIGEDKGVPFLVMEFIEGTPLSELPEAGRPWPVPRAAALVVKLALAVDGLHQRGLVHRDLKPSNVMLRPNGEPVLMDFGLARSFTTQSRQLTTIGAPVGTPAYMAPEQVRGEGKAIGPTTDVYALGVILYELLTGTLPFAGPPVAVFGQILHAQPEAPTALRPGLDAGLEAACLLALAKEPSQRFSSMAELATALMPFAGSVPTGGTEVVASAQRVGLGETLAEEQVTPAPQGRRHRHLAWAWVAGGVLLALLLWVVLARWPSGRADPSRRGREDRAGRGDQDGPKPGVPQGLAALPKEIENSLGMKLVLVKPGRFQMGSPPGEDGDSDEKPQHWVEITQPYYLGVYEVTQGEFQTVMGKDKDPSHFTVVKVEMHTSRFPVDSVTVAEAEEFCRRLSEREKAKGRVYRLPTEAEWEYACRAGTSKEYWSGNGDDALKKVGWYKGNSGSRTHAVGEKNAPNPWGLHDMHGNVREWCADGGRQYEEKYISDPVGKKSSFRQVLRGGSWDLHARLCRAAYRSGTHPGIRDNRVGFRVCVSARTP
jgi:formylglycine-generating enzyme required for sulfatase activity/tRNA A-37 threonylcarbamoyl transferase component Bud32